MKKYQIIAITNSWIANRDVMFNGKCKVILERDLTLKEARTILLDMYNKKFDGERPYARNWGVAVRQSNKHVDGATRTYEDATRSFDWDSRTFYIKEEIN